MSQEYQNQLFRLAAVLYADNNYEVTPKTIHRKIIESVLLECGTKECSIHQIVDFIEDNYKFTLEEETILEIVNSRKDEEFWVNYRNQETYVCLTEKRKQTLKLKISNKTIDYFISMFQKEYALLVEKIDSKEIIYRFLYEVFSSNTISFQKLIDNKKDLAGLINLESTNYTEKEKEIINNFLQWDNQEKNKAIFDIASYALEYCMLTNKSGASSIHLENLKHKIFYLDTNIIYRALGINGENRQKRSKTFLKKFNESGEKLIISKSTEIEFKDSIRSHADRIRRYDSPRVNSKLFQEVEIQRDIYNFYHKWRIGKYNANIDLFVADTYTVYDNFKREFNIEVDSLPPFDLKEKQTEELLKDYISSITTFKSREGNEIIGSATIDAENIHWIEKKRGDVSQNIFDTKYFFISTDQGLRRWDYHREDKTPIVLLPSQWMSILLRYLNRTEDDFKSFVNFLNLKNNEVLIDSERLHIVLGGISEMTSNIQQQRTILNNLIENKFNGVIARNYSNEQIFENAKSFAKTKLEEKLEIITKQNEELSNKQKEIDSNLDVQKELIKIKFEDLEKGKSSIEEKLSKEQEKNLLLKDIIVKKGVNEEISKWQKTAYYLILIAVLIILFIVFQFIAKEWSYNFPYKLSLWVDTIENSVPKNTLIGLMYSPLIGLWLILQFVWKRLFDSELIEEKKKIIETRLKEKFK